MSECECQDNGQVILAGGATCYDILKRALLQAKQCMNGLLVFKLNRQCFKLQGLCAYLDSDSACSCLN